MPTFCKEERLCSRKVISHLIKNGTTFFNHPFTVKWIEVPLPQNSPIQILTAVPKRNFKKAVDRNRIKRLTKEAYRTQKDFLLGRLDKKNKALALMLIYSGKKIMSQQETSLKINIILQQLSKAI